MSDGSHIAANRETNGPRCSVAVSICLTSTCCVSSFLCLCLLVVACVWFDIAQEFSENTADTAHFGCLHQQLLLPWTMVPVPGMSIRHSPQWLPHAEPGERHLLTFKDHAVLRFRGRAIPKADGFADVLMVGPGGLIRFTITLPGLGQVVIFHTHLPLQPLCQRVQFRYYATPRVPAILAHYVAGNWTSQWSQDIRVWENKIFARKPALVKGDGPILAVRSVRVSM